MAASCCGGTRSVARVDPATCNALSQGPAGLLVPETDVVGIAPGGNVGTERSVDIDVTAPAQGACPEVWTIGARLTPVHGQVGPFSLTITSVPVLTITQIPGASVTLTEPGVYEVFGEAIGSQGVTGPATNAQIRLGLYVGNTRVSADTILTFASFGPAGEYGTAGSSVSMTQLTVTAPTTVDLKTYRNVSTGTQSSAIVSWAYLRYKKISD